ncbi:type I polyketide synthase [Micromonospora mangrovi]|uniref:Beta-ketoacyl synthase N-terminal-like domain-containing protein n=2 Tax=Micromonospora TaxID=1873 RepID=A0AAU8HCE2_9ACTN
MSSESVSGPVAIVGMGCRLPGGIGSPDQLWDLLAAERDVIGTVPDDRWAGYAGRGPEHAAAVRRAIRAGGYLDDVAGFDADFFGISPREAELMDPQQRITLEVAWETLEHAGIAPGGLAASDTAVFMGVCTDDYGRRLLEDLPRLEAWSGIGASMCAVANRVSHALDLRGPSVTLDTACSASLVAIHQACRSLQAGETSLALAGGVMLVTSPGFALALEAAGALSPDGTSRAFDAAANGYVRSEGCAILALKRLADAERDGDRVLAVIRGSAVCQDGRTNGIMAPSEEAQSRLVRLACRDAGVTPADLGYVEAHGTGTGVGDPIEIRALAATAGADRPAGQPCLIGSVKTNVGHLEAASGVVGIMKTVLALRHGEIPATLSRTGLNPHIDWADSGLRVVTHATPWPRDPRSPRLAGIGNYGYGGTLAHVVVAEPPEATPEPVAPARTPMVVPLSGTSPAALRAQAAAVAAALTADPDLPAVAAAATLALRRTARQSRSCLLAADRDELVARLHDVAAGRPAPGTVEESVVRAPAGPHAVWVFSGHGAQWSGMGRDLLRDEPALGAVCDEVDAVFRAELGIGPRQAIADGDFTDVATAQAMTFVLQVGLARVWQSYGLRPAAIIGHSVGEIAAAVVAGMLDLTDAARLICRRSLLLRRVAGRGAMAMVDLPFADTADRVAGLAGVTAAIAAAPRSTVVSGDVAAVDALAARWAAEGLLVRRVAADVAFHSAQMDPLLPDLAAVPVSPRPAQLPVYSTALADPRSGRSRDAAYWAVNLREPVRFAQAVAAAAADGHRVFLEVSTHPVVAHSVLETLAASGADDGAVVPTLRRGAGDRATLLTHLGRLHCLGVPVDWHTLHPTPAWADLPTTVWQHRRFWVDEVPPPASAGLRHDVESHTVLGHRTRVQGPVPATLWQTRLDAESRPYPGGHRVLGTEILPAAVVLTTFLDAADVGLSDVALRVPVTLSAARDVQVVAQDDALTLSSRPVGEPDDHSWHTHATATRGPAGDGPPPTVGPPDAGEPPEPEETRDPDAVMALLAEIGVVGIGFPWQVRTLRRGPETLTCRIAADPDGLLPRASWASLLDGALSAAPILFPGAPLLRMPADLATVTVHGEPPAEATVRIRLVDVRWTGDVADQVTVDITATGPDGAGLRLRGVRFAAVQPTAAETPGAANDDLAGPDWWSLPGELLPDQVESVVREVVAAELRLGPDGLDRRRPLSDLGVDSLLGQSICLRLDRRFPVPLPSSLLWDRPTIGAITAYLTELVAAAREEAPAADLAGRAA